MMQYWQTELAATQAELESPYDQPYVLRLWLPTAPAPQGGYPLLFMLDGDWIQDHIVQFVAQQTPSLNYAIASLGFGQIERQVARQRRSYTYTPIPSSRTAAVDPRQPAWRCGGADHLLQQLYDTALPALAQQATRTQQAINLKRLGLYGHSYGGLFVLYALLTKPHLFTHYIAASPSLWWYTPFMQQLATQLPRLAQAIQVDLLIGAKEQWRPQPANPAEARPEGIATQVFLEQFLTALPKTKQLTRRLHVYPEAEHGAMLALSTEFALYKFIDTGNT